MRILLTGFLFGNGMSIIYSLAGGILSFLVMALMKRLKGFSVAGVSIAGGVSQYRSDYRGIHCSRESETGLLSSGTSDRRYSDRICDGNDK